MGLLIRFAGQWVAGERLEEALASVQSANALGIGALVNLLGEHVHDRARVEATLREYLYLVDAMEAEKLDACVSIKPTQFGLAIGRSYCESQVLPLFDRVRASDGGFLWMDMEGSPYTEDTLALYENLLRRDPSVGVCLQANLRRTAKDLTRLLELGGVVRLTKGAYRESASIAYTGRGDIDASFLRLLRTLFERGRRFGVATHDGKLIDAAIRLARDTDRPWEFQFLKGVRDPLKRVLVRRGYRVREYIPYGPSWLPYFTRRLRERPSNLVTMLRSLVQG